MNGPTFSIGVDATQGMSALSNIQSKMKNVGETARSELGQKLKGVFTVAAIEEVARRTGEWAQELNNSAKQLGINSDALQELKLIARKMGAPEDAVVGMFENISKSAQGALDGNRELIDSFSMLGISLEEIRNSTKGDLFSHFMSKVPANLQNAGAIRAPIAAITGNTPENYINGVQSNIGSRGGFNAAVAQDVSNNKIVPQGEVSEIAQTWSNIGSGISALFQRLAPIGDFFLHIINAAVDALGGVMDILSGAKDLVEGNFSDGLTKILGVMGNAGYAIFKAFASVLDMISHKVGNIISHIPGLKQTGKDMMAVNTTKAVADHQAQLNKDAGVSADIAKHGEGVGETVMNLAGADAALPMAKTAVKFAGKKAAQKMGLKFGKKAAVEAGQAGEDIIDAEVGGEPKQTGGPKANESFGSKAGKFGYQNIIQPLIKESLIAGSVAVAGNFINQKSTKGGTPSIDTKPITPIGYGFTELGTGKSSALAMGGTFGSGFQNKLIRLNEKQLDFLAQITKYTSQLPVKTNADSDNPNAMPGGHM